MRIGRFAWGAAALLTVALPGSAQDKKATPAAEQAHPDGHDHSDKAAPKAAQLLEGYGNGGFAVTGANPAAQAYVAGRTSPAERTGALAILASAFGLGSIGRGLLRILLAVVTLAAGLYLVLNPGEGTETLTLILVIYFIVAGLFRIGAGVSERGSDGAGWLVVNGVLSVLIGVLIGVDLPSSSEWAIGLLVGIDLIFSGFVVVMLASAGKREAGAA